MPFHPATEEWDADLVAGDPLGFPGYHDQRRALARTGESVRTGRTAHYAFVEGRFDEAAASAAQLLVNLVGIVLAAIVGLTVARRLR